MKHTTLAAEENRFDNLRKDERKIHFLSVLMLNIHVYIVKISLKFLFKRYSISIKILKSINFNLFPSCKW